MNKIIKIILSLSIVFLILPEKAQTSEKKLLIIEAKEKPNLRPFIFIILEANNEPTAVPTIISAVGSVAK